MNSDLLHIHFLYFVISFTFSVFILLSLHFFSISALSMNLNVFSSLLQFLYFLFLSFILSHFLTGMLLSQRFTRWAEQKLLFPEVRSFLQTFQKSTRTVWWHKPGWLPFHTAPVLHTFNLTFHLTLHNPQLIRNVAPVNTPPIILCSLVQPWSECLVFICRGCTRKWEWSGCRFWVGWATLQKEG